MTRKYLYPLVLFAVIANTTLFAQKPIADIPYVSSQPIIDGQMEDWWANVPKHNVDKPFQSETPSLNSATWQAAWNIDGLYFLAEVDDDVWLPYWFSGIEWNTDKIELFVDFAEPPVNGMGAKDGEGHYGLWEHPQETNPGESELRTTGIDNDTIIVYFSSAYDGNGIHSVEYFIPAEWCLNQNREAIFLKHGTIIGFDVVVVDNDNDNNGRMRAVWANTGATDENWNTMDDVGFITLTGGPSTLHTSKSDTYEIYPNPVSNMVSIELNSNIYHTLNVFTAEGKRVKTIALFNTKKCELNVSELQNGFYLLTLEGVNDIIVQKILINR